MRAGAVAALFIAAAATAPRRMADMYVIGMQRQRRSATGGSCRDGTLAQTTSGIPSALRRALGPKYIQRCYDSG